MDKIGNPEKIRVFQTVNNGQVVSGGGGILGFLGRFVFINTTISFLLKIYYLHGKNLYEVKRIKKMFKIFN
jgi:hypothetical protein